MNNSNGNTQLGISKNISGVLCYLLGWITGIIFLFIEDDKFVRFHAIQSIIVFGGITVIQVALSVIMFIFGLLSIVLGGFAFALTSIVGVISTLVWIGAFILWIILMVKAYQGDTYELPIAGEYTKKYV